MTMWVEYRGSHDLFQPLQVKFKLTVSNAMIALHLYGNYTLYISMLIRKI
jgi:hypothetical protein